MIQYCNIAANLLMTLSLVFFIILIFGRAESLVNKFSKAEYWLLKISLALATSGALFSALTNPPVTWTQFLRNLGMALLFTWAAFFHYNYFVKQRLIKKNEIIKKSAPKKKAAKKK